MVGILNKMPSGSMGSAPHSFMSILYLATCPERLATQLAESLDQQGRDGDPMVPGHIVVPNQQLGQWLRFWLARRHGIAINLRFHFLENILGDMLRSVDPRTHEAAPELLDADTYRLFVLAVLLGENDPALSSLRNYFQGESAIPSRSSWRRAWHLADLLGNFIRDYEYHRQETLIQPWIQKKPVLMGTPKEGFEIAQQAVFDHIIRLPDGMRALLNDKMGRNFKTLPQYAMEVLETLQNSPQAENKSSNSDNLPLGGTLHLFGLTQISALHGNTLRWLGQYFDLRLYHFNPLVSRLHSHSKAKDITEVADHFRNPTKTSPSFPGDELLYSWARAGAESFWLMGQLAEPSPNGKGRGLGQNTFQIEVLDTKPVYKSTPTKKEKPATPSVLLQFQKQLLGQPISASKIAQDKSLQIVGCPGAYREVETVYNSILDNLRNDPTLRQNDIAVLVTDMNKYRPVLQAVFDRPPRPLSYNLSNYSAAGLSMFGKALLGILDLALESFTRTRVFHVFLNPCFLARLGVDRDQAMIWMRWAKELGIYQGWDGQEKKDRGDFSSSRYGWRLGLQRLRLGRFMEVLPNSNGKPSARFGDVLPFADFDSQNREQLDAFSRAVEGLLPTLQKLRDRQYSGQAWAEILRNLINTFLEVPADRPEETQVRDKLLNSLELLTRWDNLKKKIPLPLAIIREFINANLEAIEGRHGESLGGGVMISSLPATRPLPYAIIYVLGLGEDIFPGSNTLTTFDLRSQERLPGDIRPAEYARFLFLETVLAAKQKLYLLYNNRDLQKDQELLPAIPTAQLRRYLNQNILTEDFVSATIALHDHSPEELGKDVPTMHDAGSFVGETDRVLALAQAKDKQIIRLDADQEKDFNERLRRRMPDFSLPSQQSNSSPEAAITIRELVRFLKNPAQAALQRHLRLIHEEDDETPPDDEPFVSSATAARSIIRHVLQNFVQDASLGSLPQALREWPVRFQQFYEEESRRCRVPEQGFGDADQAHLRETLQETINTLREKFFVKISPGVFYGPLLLGESPTPIGARRRFPPLMLPLARSIPQRPFTQIRLSSTMPLVWADDKNFDIIVLTTKKELEKPGILNDLLFEPVLFYLALLANSAAFPGEISSRNWLKSKEFHVHIANKETLNTYRYDFTEGEALTYLAELAADFLDPTTFDLLPFEVFADMGKLADAYILADDQIGNRAANYREELEEKIEEASESDRGNFWRNSLLDLAQVMVPEDAFHKVRKRFRLLDRGPAAHRHEEITE